MERLARIRESFELANRMLHGTLPIWVGVYAYLLAVAVWLGCVAFARWRARPGSEASERTWRRTWASHRKPVFVLAVIGTAASIGLSTLLGAGGLRALADALSGDGSGLLRGVGLFLDRISMSFYAMVTGVGAFVIGVVLHAVGDSLLPPTPRTSPEFECLDQIRALLVRIDTRLATRDVEPGDPVTLSFSRRAPAAAPAAAEQSPGEPRATGA